jgi:hypothetical protein
MQRYDPTGEAKLLDRPGSFDGLVVKWRAWKMRMQGWLSLVDARFDGALDDPVKCKTQIRMSMVPASLVNLGRFLFVFLLSALQGALLEVATSRGERCGWEAWRAINAEMMPMASGQRLAKLEDLLEPEFGSEADFLRHSLVLVWERDFPESHAFLRGSFTQSILVAVVRRRVPEGIRQHLHIHASEGEEDYPKLHQVIEGYLRARGGSIMGGSDPMSIDVLTSGAKGGQKGLCFRRGGFGHVQRDCPTPAQGAPKPSPGRLAATPTTAVAKTSSQPRTEAQKAKQKLMKCFNCGIMCHLSKDCRKPRKEQGAG